MVSWAPQEIISEYSKIIPGRSLLDVAPKQNKLKRFWGSSLLILQKNTLESMKEKDTCLSVFWGGRAGWGVTGVTSSWCSGHPLRVWRLNRVTPAYLSSPGLCSLKGRSQPDETHWPHTSLTFTFSVLSSAFKLTWPLSPLLQDILV